jgi:tRNA(adenine34) deaminase
MADPHESWMDLCLALARQAEPTGNTPVGSVIVRDGRELGRGVNEATTRRDPTWHAETAAIQDACRKTGSGTLAGAVLYTAMEPCPMCAWAIHCADIRHVVIGARFADLNRTDMGDYTIDKLVALGKSPMTLTFGGSSASPYGGTGCSARGAQSDTRINNASPAGRTGGAGTQQYATNAIAAGILLGIALIASAFGMQPLHALHAAASRGSGNSGSFA